MKKKSLAWILALTTALSLAGCGSVDKLVETAKDGKEALESLTGNSEDDAEEPAEEEEEKAEESQKDAPAEEAQPAEEKKEFHIGETWKVDGKWSLTVTNVTEVEERNEYADSNPAAVYLIDYVYTNDGYQDSIMDGLFFSIDETVVDASGMMGYAYPGSYDYYPKETPVGAICKAQDTIGVDNPGPFKLTVSQYDEDYNKHSATFVCDPAEGPVEVNPVCDVPQTSEGIGIGETWTVDGQWEVTVTGVTPTEERNEFSGMQPEMVYILDYTYTNIGYEDDYMDGLYFSMDSGVVDAANYMGYSYPGSVELYPQEVPVGATCNAQVCIGVDHAGPFKIYLSTYDGNDEKQRQIFNIQA